MSKLTDCRVKRWNQSAQIIDVAFPHALDLKGGGHAICAQNTNPIRLFDPNFGEFVIGDDDLQAFFGDLSMASALAGSMYLYVNVAQVSFA